jgi:hypothetical protein
MKPSDLDLQRTLFLNLGRLVAGSVVATAIRT